MKFKQFHSKNTVKSINDVNGDIKKLFEILGPINFDNLSFSSEIE